jgi:hypothetical protein
MELEKEILAKKKSNGGFLSFLQIEESEWFGAARAKEVEKAINKNLMIRLYRETFLSLEKDIFSKRIGRLFEVRKFVTINCA